MELRTGLKVEKGHAKYGRKKRAGQKQRAQEGNRLHGGAVTLARMGNTALLSCDFQVEACLALGHDVVQLSIVSQLS